MAYIHPTLTEVPYAEYALELRDAPKPHPGKWTMVGPSALTREVAERNGAFIFEATHITLCPDGHWQPLKRKARKQVTR